MVCGLGLGRGQEVISLLGAYTALSTEESDKWQGLIGCPALSDKCCDSEESAGLAGMLWLLLAGNKISRNLLGFRSQQRHNWLLSRDPSHLKLLSSRSTYAHAVLSCIICDVIFNS